MSNSQWGEWVALHLARLGPSWAFQGVRDWAVRMRERNFCDSIQSRAVWVSEDSASEEFRWVWQDQNLPDLVRRIQELAVQRGPVEEAMLAGEVLGVAGAKPEAPFPWSRDPVTGETVLDRVSTLREGEQRLLKEVGRLQVTSVLAGLALADDDEERAHQAIRLISDFDSINPYPYGVHWGYPEEVALRLLSLVWVRALLGWELIDRSVGDKLLEMVYLHQRYLNLFSDFQVAEDGRTIAVQAAQFIAGMAFPGFPESDEWRDEAASRLEEELLAQTFEDGVGRQQNSGVDARNLELALLALRLSDEWEYPLNPAVVSRIERMCEYFVACNAAREPAAVCGDVGAGRAFALPLGESLRTRSLIAVAAATFERPEWARLAGGLDPQAILVIGDPEQLDLYEEWTGVTQVERYLPPECFPKGGRFFFRSQRNPSLVVGFDCGPMGLAPLAPGAHADTLGLTIELAGHPIVVDPGSMLEPDGDGLQQYLRSTGAHSTVRINWEDSAYDAPGEVWETLTPTYDMGYAVTSGRRLIMAACSQLGYCRDGQQVVHRRMITRDSGDSYHLAIEDRIDAPADLELEYELLFHMHPDIPSIQKQRDLYQVRVGDNMLSLRFSSDNLFEVGATQGHKSPLLGWACLDGREAKPIWVLRVHGRDKAPIVIRTALFPG